MADRSGDISHADGGTFEVGYTGSFSLAASIRFLEGFTPGGHESSPSNHLDAQLRCDLESGVWASEHSDLLGLDSVDYGYRVVVAG
jgi:hypothetical protein